MPTPPRRPAERGREYALRVLRQEIVNMELEPGSVLSENELAARLGLSRTPVREAVIELAKSRVIEVYPQRGSIVALIDYDLVEQAQFMRKVLECAVAELACVTAGPGELAELESNQAMQEHYLKSEAPDRTERLFALDNEFHRLLFEAAGKLQVHAMMEGLTIHFDRVRKISLTVGAERRTVEDHRAILRAVRERDAKRARQLMEGHLEQYRIDRKALCAQYPLYFKTSDTL